MSSYIKPSKQWTYKEIIKAWNNDYYGRPCSLAVKSNTNMSYIYRLLRRHSKQVKDFERFFNDDIYGGGNV